MLLNFNWIKELDKQKIPIFLFVCFQLLASLSSDGQTCKVAIGQGTNITICSGVPTQLTAIASGFPSGAVLTYSWKPDTLSNPKIADPVVSPKVSKNYTVSVTDTGKTCMATATIEVTVNPLPTAFAGVGSTICTGNPVRLGGTSVDGNTYSWSANPSDVTLTSSNDTMSNPTVRPTLTTIYILTERIGSTGCSKSNSVKVNVNPLPTVGFTFPTGPICGGSPVLFNSSVAGPGTFSYSWNFGDNSTISNNTNPSHVFTTIGTGDKIFPVSLSVTNESTKCSDTINKNVTIKNSPDPSLDLSSESWNPILGIFLNCGATSTSPDYVFTVDNGSSTKGSNTSYSIDWGDLSLLEDLSSTFTTVTHTYKKLGFFNIIFTAKNANTGCSSIRIYKLFNGNTPGGNLGGIPNTQDCAPYTLKWPVENCKNNTPGTIYTFSVNDESYIQTFTQENLPDSISHTFNKSSCGLGFANNKFTVFFNVTNPCGDNPTTSMVQSTLKPAAQFSVSPDTTICTGSLFTVTNTSTGNYVFNNFCSTDFNKTWSITPETGWSLNSGSLTKDNIITLKFDTPGKYTIKLHIKVPKSSTTRCTEDEISKTICVEPPLIPKFTINSNEGCKPLNVNATNATDITNSCNTPFYNWDIGYTRGNCGSTSSYAFLNSTASNSADPKFRFDNPGIYSLKLSMTNSCGTISSSQTVSVQQPPEVAITNVLPTICQTFPQTGIYPKASVSNCGTAITSYLWSFPNASPLTSTLTDPDTIKYAKIGNYAINLQATNTCGTTTATPFNFNIISTPTATISGSTRVCNNSSQPKVTFSGNGGSTPYTFTYKINNGDDLKVITTGTNTSVAVSAPTNTSGTFNYNLISVQGNPTCPPTPSTGTATIIIDPLPDATISGTTSICKDEALPSITFTGSNGTAPYTFTYNLNNDTTQSITTISGNSVSVLAPTATSGTFTYNLTSVQDNSPTKCQHTLSSKAIVTVKPLPTLSTISNKVFCNNVSSLSIPFTGTITGQTNNWKISKSIIGLPETGTGDIPSFTPINSGTTPITATVIVTPTYNGCGGPQQTFTITVNPTPSLAHSLPDQTICSGDSFSQVILSSLSTGAIINWSVNPPPGISGLTSTEGTGTIPAMPLTNSTNNPINVTFYGTASLNGDIVCTRTEPYTITVNPKPSILIQNITICSGSPFSCTPSNSSGNIVPLDTKYTWEAPIVSPIGSISGGSAQSSALTIIGQTLTNNTNIPATATYKVTPISGNCTGDTFNVVVTVNPLGQVEKPADQHFCDKQSASVAFSTQITSGTTAYSWSSSANTAIVVPNSGTGDMKVNTTNPGFTTLETTITVTPTLTNGNVGCPGPSKQFKFTVNPSAQVEDIKDQDVCNGTLTTVSFTTPNIGGDVTYSWTRDNNEIGLSATGNGNISFTAINATSVPVTATFTVTPTFTNGITDCPGTAKTFTITVNPTAQVNDIADLNVCNGDVKTISFSTNNQGGTTTYAWSKDNVDIGLALSGTGDIALNAVNNTTAPITTVVTVSPTFEYGGKTCTGLPMSFSITVNPSPVVTFTPALQTICSGESTVPVTLGSITENVSYAWISLNVPGLVGNILNGVGEIPSHQLINTTNETLTVIYKARAVMQGGNSGCFGGDNFHQISVNTKPFIAKPFTLSICSGDSFSYTPTDGSGNIIPKGTTYTWKLLDVKPLMSAISGSNAQSEPQDSISQKLTNNTNKTAIATYIVTPRSGDCDGIPFEVIITVYPKPQLDKMNDISLCPNVPYPQINLTGYVEGTLYEWKSSSTTTGINDSGTGYIPPFTSVNNSTATLYSDISVKLSINGCVTEVPKAFTISVNPNLPVSINITTPASTSCHGMPIVFQAVPIHEGLEPVYQWYVNNMIAGANNSTFTYSPEDGDKIFGILTSDAICPTGNPATSNEISMTVYSTDPASVSIKEDANGICPGDVATFTATPYNEGFDPQYKWYVNEKEIIGVTSSTYSYQPINGDNVKCRLTSSNLCASSTIALSNEITMVVALPAIVPNFEIINTNQYKQCAPLNIVFKNISPTNGLNYIWEFGDGEYESSPFKEFIPHTYQNITNTAKTYKVGLKIITSGTNCYIVAKDSIIVEPEINAGSPVNYQGCSPVTKTFENAKPGAKSYRWVAGDKMTVLSSKLMPTFTFEALHKIDTTYIVYLIAESANGCFDTIVNTIKVSPPLIIPSFTYSSIFDCETVTYTFSNTSLEGAGLFVWDFDDGTINRTYHANETVAHTFKNGIDIPVIFNVTLLSSSGSYCSSSVTHQIMVDPKYTAGFPVALEGCSPFTRTFDNAYPGAMSYRWESADGELLGTNRVPEITLINQTGRDSTYKVFLFAESTAGCLDTVVNTVIVRSANKTDFTFAPAEGCAPLSVRFNTAASSQIIGYQWDFGDTSDHSATQAPRHIYINTNGNEAKYKVGLFAYNQYGCGDTVSHEIHLLPTPQVGFIATPSQQVYPDRTIQLTNLTPSGNWSYTWDFNDQKPLLTGTVTNYTYDLPGEYVISLKAKGTQCERTKYVKVVIDPGLPIAAFEPDSVGCAPMRVKFRNYSQNGSHYNWDFGNGRQSEEFEPVANYYDSGDHKVKLTVTNLFGVKANAERIISVYPVPRALFKPQPYRVKIPQQSVTFFNFSENAMDYRWDFGDGESSLDFSPMHQYFQTGIFDITLYVTSSNGCKDTAVVKAGVDAFNDGLKVPNAFMPSKEGPTNGDFEYGDPRNHVFYPALAPGDVVEYVFRIYNRWGNLMFVTNEANRGWDGYYNGKLCPQDVYIWMIRCKFKSGDVVTKSGDVTLIR